MDPNLLSHLIFFPAMVALAVWVARTANANGAVWLMSIFNDAGLVTAVNNILLVGCYVVNIGYIALVLADWDPVASIPEMLGALSIRFALIIITLAALHYTNIAVLLIWSRIERDWHGTAPHAASDPQAPVQIT